MNLPDIIHRLNALADPAKAKLKHEKFAITASNTLGVYQKDLKILAREIGFDNDLALALFDSGIYEARLLCSKTYDPEKLSQKQMDQWVVTFENWEICDSFCMALFAKSPHALDKAFAWSEHEAEFVKRAGFTIMAAYGFSNKQAGNEIFEEFLAIVEREADDDRLYVRKAVNWVLRNVGKRNVDLRDSAIATANRISQRNAKSARWIASDALRELNNPNAKVLDYPRAVYR
ncbi:MAG: DNA alkylation repair protein [Granulosicoccus sp.]